MLRATYHEALEETSVGLIQLLGLLADSLTHAVASFVTADTRLAARIIGGVDDLLVLETQIESGCVQLIWKQQPLAGELRAVAAMHDIAVDAQHIAEGILTIAKDGVRLADMAARPATDGFQTLAASTIRDVRDALGSFKTQDGALADVVLRRGDAVEAEYHVAIGGLQEAMRDDARMIEGATTLLFALAALLRCSEHAWSIARHTKAML